MLTKGNPSPVPYLETLAKKSGRPVAVAAIQYDHSKPDRAFADQVADARLRQIVAIGFFLSNGLHGEIDVPNLLQNAPGGEDSHYLGPIGTDDLFADAILERVRAFDQQHPPAARS